MTTQTAVALARLPTVSEVLACHQLHGDVSVSGDVTIALILSYGEGTLLADRTQIETSLPWSALDEDTQRALLVNLLTFLCAGTSTPIGPSPP